MTRHWDWQAAKLANINYRRADPGTTEASTSAPITAAPGRDGTVVLDMTALWADVVTSLTRSWALERSADEAAADALLITIPQSAAESLMFQLQASLMEQDSTMGAPLTELIRAELHAEAMAVQGVCNLPGCPVCGPVCIGCACLPGETEPYGVWSNCPVHGEDAKS